MQAGQGRAGQGRAARARRTGTGRRARGSQRLAARRLRRPAPKQRCPSRHVTRPLAAQADKLENGEGHTSPLGIEIPGAEAGREWEYYYHDR